MPIIPTSSPYITTGAPRMTYEERRRRRVAPVRQAVVVLEQPIAEIAETAVETLQSLIADPERPVPNSYFRPQVRVRGTTSPPKPKAVPPPSRGVT
ncbi:MAG TPA: hypothetical protein VLW49_00625 [Gaiellaceae bacterium]|nr:hypothetical protein [Gaiellaceae bacterium]